MRCSRCRWATDVPYMLGDERPLCPTCVLSLTALAVTSLEPAPLPVGDEVLRVLERLDRYVRGDIA